MAHFYKEAGRSHCIPVYARHDFSFSPGSGCADRGVWVGGSHLSSPGREQGFIGSGPTGLIYSYDYMVGDPFTFIRALIKVAF